MEWKLTVNSQRKQNWIAKSTNVEENAGKKRQFLSSEQSCELKSLDVALNIAGVKKKSSENLRLRSTLEVIQFEFWLKGALATVEICVFCGWGGNRGVNLPSPYFLSQFLPPPYFFESISPSSLNGYVSVSPSSLLFPPISPSSQLCLGHFSLLPILFLPPLLWLVILKSVWYSVGDTF